MKKTFNYKGTKATIKSNKEANEFYVTITSKDGDSYTTTNPTLYWAISDVKELSDNNTIGNKLSEMFIEYFESKGLRF